MSCHSCRIFRLLWLSFGLLLAATAWAAGEREQARLDTLREQRSTLEKQLQHSEDNRKEANEELRSAERAISVVGRKLRDLGEQRAAARQQLGEQERALKQLERQQQQRQEQLARLLRHQFGGRDSDALAILLAGGDPNQAARDRHFLTLLSRAKAELIASMRQDALALRGVAAQVRAHGEQLAELTRHEETERTELRQRQREQQAALDKIARQIKDQRRRIDTLKQNEQRLANLITRLAQSPAKAGKKKPAAAPAGRTPAGRAPAAEPVASGGTFAKLRGKLLQPVDGTLAARFGTRRDDGQSVWKGVFFRAAEGAAVKAVAAGTVVFSDWLRGYGNLLIVDHDDDFLSVYGNNQSLLADVGQKVGAGATVATAGTGIGTGGEAVESGLYFELRHRGQVFDPAKWLGGR